MVKKLQKIYVTYYNLSVALDIVCLVTKIINTKFDEKLKERFLNTRKLSNHGNSKFILLLQKGVYLMNIWMIQKNSIKRHYLK